MSLTFARLFKFAKSTAARQLENFTTEALAAAIRADVRPVAAALAAAGVLRSDGGDVGLRTIGTQVDVGRGIVDLVLELESGDGSLELLWIEVKAHAGEHGDQIANYLDAAEQQAAGSRPRVVMLCKRPITDRVPTLRWNHVRAAARYSRHPYWADLVTFLEQHRMADANDEPITAAELDVGPRAHSLYGKVARLIREVVSTLKGPTAGLGFPDRDKLVARHAAAGLWRHPRLVVKSGTYPWVFFGVDFTRDTELAIWLEVKDTDVAVRAALLEVASALSADWIRLPPGWQVLRATKLLTNEIDQDTAMAWFEARFDELERSGVLDHVLQPRVGAQAETEDVDELDAP